MIFVLLLGTCLADAVLDLSPDHYGMLNYYHGLWLEVYGIHASLHF